MLWGRTSSDHPYSVTGQGCEINPLLSEPGRFYQTMWWEGASTVRREGGGLDVGQHASLPTPYPKHKCRWLPHVNDTFLGHHLASFIEVFVVLTRHFVDTTPTFLSTVHSRKFDVPCTRGGRSWTRWVGLVAFWIFNPREKNFFCIFLHVPQEGVEAVVAAEPAVLRAAPNVISGSLSPGTPSISTQFSRYSC